MPPDPPTDLEERLTHLDRLLDEGLELGSTDQEAWLARVRSADPALAEALAELLAREAEIDAAGFLQHPAPVQPHVTSLAGRRIGAYTLERPLGRGGMGTVWLARRSDGRFEGRAAIKLLNLPLLDAAGAERFRREATALARLAHPNIARLIDAGVAEDGQPYLVLEYVDGVRIDRYADERRLSPTDRIALLLQVLDAVGHAHANLIVHRDIKPSNLLVADGHVHVIDVAFATVRPTPWRQAVDLANMMLTLALVAGPPRVLARAERFFDRDELAEAFAATSALTVPRQLRRRIDDDGRDLVEEFRRLLPDRTRIRVQRWSMRRVLLALATCAGALLSVALVALNLRAGGLL